MKRADIGLIGLAVMGENLVMNMESKGFTVAVFNRTTSKVDNFVQGKQSMLRESPAMKAYCTMVQRYGDLQKKLADLLPEKKDAQKASTDAERARIKGIEEIENTIADKDLINEAKYGESPMTAEQLALKALQAQSKIGATVLDNLDDDTKESGADGVNAVPNGGEAKEEPDADAEAKNIAAIYNKMKGVK